MLNLARTLGLEVIAEGVEAAGQVAFLQSLDCGFGQGYFFSRPIPADEATRLLDGVAAGARSLAVA
ncbi:MAG: hypothetical protein DMF93_10085 [Acidobacteria bacterium]|nr:MAG: hypothetical protein DMF93_10085 [Acidobacteriota bacterium]